MLDPAKEFRSWRIWIRNTALICMFFYIDLDLAALSAFRAKSRKLKISKSLQKRE